MASWSLRSASIEAQATCITLISRAAHNAGLGLLNFEYISGMNRTDESTHSSNHLITRDPALLTVPPSSTLAPDLPLAGKGI